MGYSRLKLEDLEPKDRFFDPPFSDVYELVEKSSDPSLLIQHLDGPCYQHGTLLRLGRTVEVNRIDVSPLQLALLGDTQLHLPFSETGYTASLTSLYRTRPRKQVLL